MSSKNGSISTQLKLTFYHHIVAVLWANIIFQYDQYVMKKPGKLSPNNCLHLLYACADGI